MSRVKPSLVAALVLSIASAGSASAATFESAVEKILAGQTSGPVKELDAVKRKELAACIVGVLDKVPEAKKQQVASGKDYDEMQDRFGEIVMADRARLKQQITLQCGEIAVSS